MISALGSYAARVRSRKASSLGFDLDGCLRWLKPHRRRHDLHRRGDDALDWVDDAVSAGARVLLDTTVYIDVLQGRSPPKLDSLLRTRACEHSAVCISELTHPLGRLNPADPRTKR